MNELAEDGLVEDLPESEKLTSNISALLLDRDFGARGASEKCLKEEYRLLEALVYEY